MLSFALSHYLVSGKREESGYVHIKNNLLVSPSVDVSQADVTVEFLAEKLLMHKGFNFA